MRARIEEAFGHLARFLFRNPGKTLLFMLLVMAATLGNLPRVAIDTSTEGFLHEDDPALVAYNDFRHQFGRDEMIVIAIGPTQVFDLGFLEKLQAFHAELEESVPPDPWGI